MQTRSFTFVLFALLVVIFHQPSAYAGDEPSVQEQLQNMNSFWAGKNLNDNVLSHDAQLGEIPLIQTHLSLVEQTLRERIPEGLTGEQLKNRLQVLDILHQYWLAGVFPKNLYHKERTPYFIDDYGTACAVGHLMIETGYEDAAEKIRQENNYGYLMDLQKDYNEIHTWAALYGFTLEELAWIQPSYGCMFATYICGYGEVKSPSCAGQNDGCYNPVIDGLDTLQIQYMQTRMKVNGVYQPDYFGYIVPICQLPAGDFLNVYYLNSGDSFFHYYTMTEPEDVSVDVTGTDDNGTCNGTLSAAALGGTGSFGYEWSNGETGAEITTLCPGEYTVTATDENGCSKSSVMQVNRIVSTPEIPDADAVKIYPNPANDYLQVENAASLSTYRIVDPSGRTIKSGTIENEGTIDLNELGSGLYFIHLQDAENKTTDIKRVVKS